MQPDCPPLTVRERALDAAVRNYLLYSAQPPEALAPIVKCAGRCGVWEAERRFAPTVTAIRTEFALAEACRRDRVPSWKYVRRVPRYYD
jgi:hypothetical protein